MRSLPNRDRLKPSSLYRARKNAGRMRPSKKDTDFEQPIAAHGPWHIDIAHINIHGTFYLSVRGAGDELGPVNGTPGRLDSLQTVFSAAPRFLRYTGPPSIGRVTP